MSDPNTYTVDIPGMSDIFKLPVPALNNKELKRQRIARMKTHVSPIPKKLQWIPPVINKIDDAQDLLYTGLYVGKFLLRRVAPRFIPGVGWVLLALDVMNLATKVFGLAMTPGLTKTDVHGSIRKTRQKAKDLEGVFRDFIAPGGWRRKLSFALQAPQALETVTGSGLVLGSVMGFLSETIWGTIKAAAFGEQIRFRKPPPSDPVMKAYNYMMQRPQAEHARDILSLEDHALLLAADNIAVGLILDAATAPPDDRINECLEKAYPVFLPWEESSLAALEEEGVPVNDDCLPYTPDPDTLPTISKVLDDAIIAHPNWAATIRSQIPENEFWSVMYDINREAGEDMIYVMSGIPSEAYSTFDQEIVAAMHLAECDFQLFQGHTDQDRANLIKEAITQAGYSGFTVPRCIDWEAAAYRLDLYYCKKSVNPCIRPLPTTLTVTCKDAVKGWILASCYITIVETNQKGVTGAGGYYTFPQVEPGSYTVSINRMKYVSQTQSIQINPGASAELLFLLQPIVY